MLMTTKQTAQAQPLKIQLTLDQQRLAIHEHLPAQQQLQILKEEIAPLQHQLLQHSMYTQLTHPRALHIFMEHHVFAVWDFMCLLKRLQQQLTCTQPLWTPPYNLQAARLINEIVVAEETDVTPDGSYASHFQLYLDAMAQVEANTTTIETFICLLNQRVPYPEALFLAPTASAQFVTETLEVCHTSDAVGMAAYFLFGRENLIPDLFTQMVQWLALTSPINIQSLMYYLNRHIELDGEEHGPAGEQLMISLCGTSEQAWQQARWAAVSALQSRLRLWDGIAAAIG